MPIFRDNCSQTEGHGWINLFVMSRKRLVGSEQKLQQLQTLDL